MGQWNEVLHSRKQRITLLYALIFCTMIDSYSKIDFLKTKLKQDKKRESRATFLYGKRKITFALDVRMEDFLEMYKVKLSAVTLV